MNRVIIMGAAGRDFHNFNTYFRDNPDYNVVAFTASQIPNIANRRYPPSLSGELYPEGIPIFPEDDLPELIHSFKADQVIFAYSDISHLDVMHKASLALSCGADFRLLGPQNTMIKSNLPMVAVTGVRTGSGKSQTTRYVAKLLKRLGYSVAIIRHPMPYGNLEDQALQRFASYSDLDVHKCTIEEREEYESHIDEGFIVYAGVDYAKILRQAEDEADVIIWDGGNNDFPFYAPDLHIVIVDPHRTGDETLFHPGETNLRMADIVIINKVDSAEQKDVKLLKKTIAKYNPRASLILSNSRIAVDRPELIKGKRVLVLEDGPTLTHGNMEYGAGAIAAKNFNAVELIDPRPFAVGSIAETLERWPHIGNVLPAMGYSQVQIEELQQTINNSSGELILIGTPIDLRRFMQIDKPSVRVSYSLEEIDPKLEKLLKEMMLSQR